MTIEANDSGGLICGFVLGGAGPALQLPGGPQLPTAAAPLWLHFNLADTRATKWIESCELLPFDARELLLSHDTHVRHEAAGHGLALVIGDLHHEFDGDPEGIGTMRIYIDKQIIITGRRHPLKTVDRLRRMLGMGLVVAGTGDLFAKLIEELAETFQQAVKHLADVVDEAEDEILAGRAHDRGTELGGVRRLIARLRRQINSGRQALGQGVNQAYRWAGSDDISEARQAVEHLDSIAQDLDLVQERARLLQEEIAARLGEATNRNLYLLSVMTTVLLPINLITGIFGMNTGGLPWAQDAHGFWRVLVFMSIGVVVSLGVLRRRQVL
jgi:zinc transporter